jgi:hypothetical protein
MIILGVMILLFAVAGYCGYTWFGQQGLGGVVALAVVTLAALWALGGLQVG